ncbi:MAG: WbqC family protein [Bacteroidales bacterium]|nr:WbqC family protein [Bacteroidales bacterium]
MNTVQHILFSTAYAGPIVYYAYFFLDKTIFIENKEYYIKQTYRNRTVIMTSNGLLPLIIPVIKVNGNHTKVKDILISNAEKWQQLHWRTISSAYSNSPYFMYYKDALEPFYQKRFDFLFEFNQKLLNTILGILSINPKVSLTEKYNVSYPIEWIDLRTSFSPKKKQTIHFPEYSQVFQEKIEFTPNLSIFDLLFNEGPASVEYLKQINPPCFS